MSKILKRFYTVIGNVTLDHVKQMNKKGPEWVSAIDKVAKEEEQADPRITKIKIQGALAHKSHTDPNDPQDVISVQFLDENGSRIKSKHVHEDGTSKEK